MEIRELILRKESLEKSIHDFLRVEFEQFRKDTGFSPSSVYVSLRDITGLGDENPRYMVDNVEISVDARGVNV